MEETEISADRQNTVLDDLLEELKTTKRQRIREIMKRPEQEALIEETYDELEAELQKKIEGIHHQIDMIVDRRNTILRVNRAGKLALEVFQDILNKDKLERNNLELMIEKKSESMRITWKSGSAPTLTVSFAVNPRRQP